MTAPHRVGLVLLAALSAGLGSAGCASAGRQAAWEKEPVTTAPAPAPKEEVTPLAEQAAAHWAKRDDKAALQKAIDTWEALVAKDPQNHEALTMLARAYYFLVDAHLVNEQLEDIEELQLELHTKGADYGERALMVLEPEFERTMREGGDFIEAMKKIDPKSISAAYWYCTNLGRFAVAKGISAKLFYKDRVSAAMTRIREMDPKYFYAAGDRYLGAFYAALPGIAGKDLDKSATHFAEARKNGPAYIGNLVVQAEFLAVEQDDRESYEKLLKEALAAPDGDDPNIAPENRAAKRAAKRLLAPEVMDDTF